MLQLLMRGFDDAFRYPFDTPLPRRRGGHRQRLRRQNEVSL